MQIKASVAAVMLAFAGTAAWAGESAPPDDAVVAPDGGWKFLNGEPAQSGAVSGGQADSQSLDANEQAKTSLGFTEGDQTDDDEAVSDKMAGTDAPSGESGASTGSSDADAAMSEEEGDRFTAATPDEQSDSENPAMAEDQSGQPAGAQSQDSADQPAHSPREPDSGQSASSGEDGSDQASRSQEQDEEMAGTEEGDEQSAEAEGDESDEMSADSGMPANLQGKVVVIIPKDWEGSLEGLLSALQGSPDAKDIVIVQQGNPGEPADPQADSSDEPGDSYEASRPTPPLNQQ